MKRNPEDRPGKPLIIPFFIMNGGCPGKCVFCNEKIAAGDFTADLRRDVFDAQVEAYLRWDKDRRRRVEIAFYGGNFTGLARADQERLLGWAGAFLESGRAASVRISTRPDDIDAERLEFLRARGVQTVELGVQSFSDAVLRRARRGHDADASVRAIRLLKACGFETGVHLMAGLPGDTKESFAETLAQTAKLRPDTARIHPVLVFCDTPLADDYRCGRYAPLDLAQAVLWCRTAWDILVPAGVRIIRFGLQTTPEMAKDGAVLAGPLHPSFGSLVYASIFLSQSLALLSRIPRCAGRLCFRVAGRDQSHFRGPANANIETIKKLYPGARIVIDTTDDAKPGHLSLCCDTGDSFSLDIPGMQ
ncbi:MAG: radical SAM protein [Smithellaceae bacterium]|nr:radical SAM protein [Smithellaceae bacterium]